MQRHLWRAPLAILLIAGAMFLAACSSTSTAATPTGTPALSPTPALTANGDYAFVRFGDLWARLGSGPAYQLTYFHLGETDAIWGQITWSPDHQKLAFVLLAPPTVSGSSAGARDQQTGSLYVVDLTSRNVMPITQQKTAITVPLEGRHLAWLSATVLLFTTAGTVQRLDLANGTAISTLSAPQNVWEIVARGTTVYYSTISGTDSSGAGIAQLRRIDLSTPASDKLVAALGPANLPAAICGGYVCPPDATTPAVPYAWAVSADGASSVYQVSPSFSGPTASATATTTLTPTVTPTAGTTVTPTATATGATVTPTATATATTRQPNYFLTTVGTATPQPIFQGVMTAPGATALAFAPDGSGIALAALDPSQTAFGPFVQQLGSVAAIVGKVITLAPTNDSGSYAGLPSWTTNSQGITLSTLPATGAGSGASTSITLTLAGQPVTTELNASDFAWSTS